MTLTAQSTTNTRQPPDTSSTNPHSRGTGSRRLCLERDPDTSSTNPYWRVTGSRRLRASRPPTSSDTARPGPSRQGRPMQDQEQTSLTACSSPGPLVRTLAPSPTFTRPRDAVFWSCLGHRHTRLLISWPALTIDSRKLINLIPRSRTLGSTRTLGFR